MDTDAKAGKQTQINTEMALAGTTCDLLQSVVDELEKALESILSDADLKELKESTERELVPLAHRIRSNRERVNKQATRISDILNRLEL